MGQLRSALRAFAFDERSPAAVLERLSGLLRQLAPGWGATLLYGLLEPHAGAGTVARAGHPPPLLIDADGTAAFVDLPASVPLGAVRYPEYADTDIALGPWSTLLLYTDGLIERTGESLDTGLDRLRAAAKGREPDPQLMCDRLMRHLLPEGAVSDDAALLVVTVPALSDPFKVSLPAEAESITLVRRVMGRWLDEAGASDDEVGEITLACSEACANAIEHAYGPDATSFEVEASSSSDGVTLVVRDTGQWREPRGRNRGRGFTLMRGLMDHVEVTRGDDGTAVHLTRRLMRLAA